MSRCMSDQTAIRQMEMRLIPGVLSRSNTVNVERADSISLFMWEWSTCSHMGQSSASDWRNCTFTQVARLPQQWSYRSSLISRWSEQLGEDSSMRPQSAGSKQAIELTLSTTWPIRAQRELPDQSESREKHLTNHCPFFKSDWPAVGEEQEVRCTDNHLQLPPVSQPICKPSQDHLTKGEEEGTECADYCPRLGCDPLNLWGDTQLGRQTSAQVDS